MEQRGDFQSEQKGAEVPWPVTVPGAAQGEVAFTAEAGVGPSGPLEGKLPVVEPVVSRRVQLCDPQQVIGDRGALDMILFFCLQLHAPSRRTLPAESDFYSRLHANSVSPRHCLSVK